MDLLFRQHPGEDLPALDDPVEQSPVVVPDQLEGVAVAREHVVLLLDRPDVVGLGESIHFVFASFSQTSLLSQHLQQVVLLGFAYHQ